MNVLFLSSNFRLFDEFSEGLKKQDENIKATSVPSPLRTLGSLSMICPDTLVIDLSVRGLDTELKKIVEAASKNEMRLLFFNSETSGSSLLKMLDEEHEFVSSNTAAALINSVLVNAPEDMIPKLDSVYTDAPQTVTTEDGKELPSLDSLLILLLESAGSDLHLSDGSKPRIRIHGSLNEVADAPRLMSGDVDAIIAPALDERRAKIFAESNELDFSYSIPGRSRFRVNIFKQRGSTGAVFRTIPFGIPSMETLGLPEAAREFAERPRGIVLVTGPTGSGKSTTLASMIDYINENKPLHIITLEDPIEFMHRNKKALVNQREVGEDTSSFNAALKYVLRQDPDVILIGELRDLETISAAITAAETGHLVFGTLHTVGGPETIDRIIDVFPPAQQNQIKTQLSNVLVGVLSQILCPKADGSGRVMAAEVMAGVPAIANLIREGKTHQMASIIQAGSQHGMMTLDQSLRKLAKKGVITPAVAYEKAQDPKTMAEQLDYKPE